MTWTNNTTSARWGVYLHLHRCAIRILWRNTTPRNARPNKSNAGNTVAALTGTWSTYAASPAGGDSHDNSFSKETNVAFTPTGGALPVAGDGECNIAFPREAVLPELRAGGLALAPHSQNRTRASNIEPCH